MAAIHMTTARTRAADPEEAAAALTAGIGAAPRLAVLFASSDRDHAALGRAIRARLPAGTRLIGASTDGEVDRDGIHHGAALLAGLHGDFEVGIGVGRGLSADGIEAGAAAIEQAAAGLGASPADLDPKRCVGLVIDDGFRYKKEELLIGVLRDNPGLVLVGGGAASSERDPAKQRAWVYLDDEVVTDAVLVAVFRTDAPWAALRSHWYEPSGRTIRITRVDDSCTRALEIDDKPAAAYYAELLGVGVEGLEFGLPGGFSDSPTGLRIGNELVLRSPWKPLPDGSILFANMLTEGTEFELMRRTDPAASVRTFFAEQLPQQVRAPTCALLFNCGGRIWAATGLGILDELSRSFHAAPPAAGMNVHFEIYRGLAINTTLTVLAFGDSEG